MAFLDIDSTQKRVYGHQKHGAAFGHTKIQGKSLLVRGLNALAATISTPLAARCAATSSVAARIARHGRGHITVHLPEDWHRETGWMSLFNAACGPPAAAA